MSTAPMTAPNWLTLQQAREAMRGGRLSDAARLLQPLVGQGHRRALAVHQLLLRRFVERALRSLRQDDVGDAWDDLLRAERIDRLEPGVVHLRELLNRGGIAELRASLEAGKPGPAVEAATKLRERGVHHPELPRLTAAAEAWAVAAELADRGEFPLARRKAEGARDGLTCPDTGLVRFLEDIDAREARFREAVGHMEKAVAAGRWAAVVEWADRATAAAPGHPAAQQARARAWQMLQRPNDATVPGSTDSTPAHGAPLSTRPRGPLKRFLLWIDGVGGYLVCMAPHVTLGHAAAEVPTDVPILAEVNRAHAVIVRDPEGFTLEAGKPVRVNGKPVERAVLACGDRITLGASCQLLFNRPLAISSTARLTLTSGHRLPVSVDAVILMADMLILGPEGGSHVPIPGLSQPLILLRQGDGLAVRHALPYRVDGVEARDLSPLTLPAAVHSDRFSFAVEPFVGRVTPA